MKGKTIFITGATSGIGEGCARKFAAMEYTWQSKRQRTGKD